MGVTMIHRLLTAVAGSLSGRASRDLYLSHLSTGEVSAPPGVNVTWLGTAGALVSDGRTGILVDPYVSRFSLSKVILGSALHPDRELIRQWVGRLGAGSIHAVIVSHSHFDHALDAPFFALETGSPLMGSGSTLNVGRGAGMKETLLVKVQPGKAISVGDFSITIIESRHGPALFGKVPYPGTIEGPVIPPRPARDYRLGATYALLVRHPSGTILHHGSAGFIPGMYEGIRADVVLLGIAGRGNTLEYLAEVPLRVGARTVVPVHFDDFFQPLDRGLSFLYTGHLAEFCSTAEKSSLTVRTLPIGKRAGVLPD